MVTLRHFTHYRAALIVALVIATGSCGGRPTSLWVRVEAPASPEIVQLKFSATVDSEPVTEPALRPETPGAPLQFPQTVRMLLDESLDGATIRVDVEGYGTNRTLGLTGAAFAVARRGQSTEVTLRLSLPTPECGTCVEGAACVDGTCQCTPQTCRSGCCSEAGCLPPDAVGTCELGGGRCELCLDAGRSPEESTDAGAPDSGERDAGAADAGAPDAGAADAGAPDAGAPDAGAPDAGAPDAGDIDAGLPDAGNPDAGLPDAGVDAGTPTVEEEDADAGCPSPAAATPGAGVALPGHDQSALVTLPRCQAALVGGVIESGGAYVPVDQVQLFDPHTNSWTSAPAMHARRDAHTATRLPGGKVLVAGGGVTGATFPASGELYDTTTLQSKLLSSPLFKRARHTATLLRDGRVLLVGGSGPSILPTTVLVDSLSGQPTAGPALATARERHTATLLKDGRVLIAGGLNASGALADAVLFANNAFVSTGAMKVARHSAAAVLLKNGKVLVVGGLGAATTTALATAELFDPAHGTWTLLGAALAQPRASHRVELLPDGRALVMGGTTTTAYLKTTEVFDPNTGTFSAGPTMGAYRADFSSISLPNGNILVAGGGLSTPSSEQLLVPLWKWLPSP